MPASIAEAAATVNKGDTAWMLVATVLVILMTIPSLAIFYGGLVRSKNVLSVLMQVFICFCMIAVLWFAYGYSVAFTNGTPFFGGLSKAFLTGVNINTMAATFSKETYLPEFVYIIFQLTFAAITPALIVGAFAERMKFSAVLLFLFIWFTFSYLPVAHMVWWWAGPDAYTLSAANIDAVKAAVGEQAAADFLAKLAAATDDTAKTAVLSAYKVAVDASNGWLFNWGAIDFAGGSVVHINAGIAGLVCALVLGKRVGLGKEPMAPHNLSLTVIGAALLWVGWFGFNAGSNLEANGLTALAFLNTLLATAAAALAWTAGEWMFRGHPSMLGGVSGAIAGLVAITPACGWVGPTGALIIGVAAGFICLWSVVWLKAKLGYDDALDVFGVHGIGGMLGALLTGVFVNPALGGVGVTDYLATDTSSKVADYVFSAQMTAQIVDILTVIVLSAVVSYIALMICKVTVGLRVTEQEEREGLDIIDHGERAYN
ncbi:MAG: ammonium transporter [Rhizobiales bacterium]|nr:ammonium transporter [Hyphomicrobiales bacterium]MBI3674501.1 ammonium transporter [Hyphomicrobiales bacterium]